jgi:glycosyltransferase involved in cell wall biosynthesis
VLAVNKFFYVRGGCERYFFDLNGLLSSKGHEVFHLSMQSPRNEPSEDEGSFVSEVDFSSNGSLGDSARRGLRVLYSAESRRAMESLVRERRPDLVHMHNIAHQLSPSILLALKGAGPPVVQTLHDYKLVCPIYVLMRDGHTCEDCRGGRFYNVVVKNCHPGGLAAGAANAAEMYLHRSILKSYDAVDLFICPSRFLLDKMVEFGVSEERLTHLPYFLPVRDYTPGAEKGRYYVYSGRLSREKGLRTLLQAASRVPDQKLVVLGEGPLGGELRSRYGAEPWVEFRGHLPWDELVETVSGASFSVVPSEWYENLPLTVMESFALGVPVVASRIGGLPEMVTPGETGLLVEPGDPEDLASAIAWLGRNDKARAAMRIASRRFAESEYNPEAHYESLMGLYKRVLQ